LNLEKGKLGIDFGKTAQDYLRHRAGFPQELFARLRPFRIGLAGQDILDLGTGTGSLARGFAAEGARVTALDISPQMLAAAATAAKDAGLEIAFQQAPAEATGLPPESFDVVAAGQCWHWFDRAKAAAEAKRLLRPGGFLLIAHFDWLPLPGNVVAETEALIEAHNPSWALGGGTGFYPQWAGDALGAGFRDLETFTCDQDVPYSHEAWRGRIRASAGVGGSLAAAQVGEFDAALAGLLATHFPGDPLQVPHRLFALIARKP